MAVIKDHHRLEKQQKFNKQLWKSEAQSKSLWFVPPDPFPVSFQPSGGFWKSLACRPMTVILHLQKPAYLRVCLELPNLLS